jgi:hypothetical protein
MADAGGWSPPWRRQFAEADRTIGLIHYIGRPRARAVTAWTRVRLAGARITGTGPAQYGAHRPTPTMTGATSCVLALARTASGLVIDYGAMRTTRRRLCRFTVVRSKATVSGVDFRRSRKRVGPDTPPVQHLSDPEGGASAPGRSSLAWRSRTRPVAVELWGRTSTGAWCGTRREPSGDYTTGCPARHA